MAQRRTRAKSAGGGEPSTIHSILEDEEWYHGLLPREDITKMLQQQGDWLVRRTEVNGAAKHVLSVYWDGRARHVVLHKDNEQRHLIDPQDRSFATIQELVQYYKRKGQALPRVPYILLSPVPKQDWELRHDWISLEKKIGEGAFGEVFKARLRCRDGAEIAVAVKRSHVTKELTKEQVIEIVSESRIMQKYKHPNLVRLWGVAAEVSVIHAHYTLLQTQPIMLVLELVAGGGLDGYLQKNHTSTAMKIRFCLDAAKGTEYLHKKECIHRDLACRNCLISDRKVVKISDFGLSQEGTSYKMKANSKVPIRWLAPETMVSMTYTLRTDVWSFGVMMWEIMHNGVEPYPGMRAPEVAVAVKTGYKMSLDGDADVPSGARNIILASWITDPLQRPTLYDIRLRLEQLHAQMTPAVTRSEPC